MSISPSEASRKGDRGCENRSVSQLSGALLSGDSSWKLHEWISPLTGSVGSPLLF